MIRFSLHLFSVKELRRSTKVDYVVMFASFHLKRFFSGRMLRALWQSTREKVESLRENKKAYARVKHILDEAWSFLGLDSSANPNVCVLCLPQFIPMLRENRI